MGWPKGKPRKGHVNKDGSVHKAWGSISVAREAIKKVRVAIVEQPVTSKPKRGRPAKQADGWNPEWNKILVRKRGPWVAADTCPACGFPEADAGYCNACGWMEPVRMGRVA